MIQRPMGGNGTPTTSNSNTSNIQSAHASIISIGLLLVAIFVMVELAGTNPQLAKTMALILAGLVAIKMMNSSGNVASFVGKYPWIP